LDRVVFTHYKKEGDFGMTADRYINTSLSKALTLLDLFSGKTSQYTLTEIAHECGTQPGTIYPIVFTLEKFGYLVREKSSKRYSLGLKILTHANHVLANLDMRDQACPILRNLANELTCNAHLAVPYEGEVLYLDREESAPSVVVASVIGWRAPLYCTALGKVFLAFCLDVEQRFMSQSPQLDPVTPNTITNLEVLAHELRTIRELGHSYDREELYLGNTCMAAPVRDYRGDVVAAISISNATSRFDYEPREKFVKAVVDAAWQISKALGCVRPRPI